MMNDKQDEGAFSTNKKVVYGYYCRCLAWRFYRNLSYLGCFILMVYVCAVIPVFSPPLWFSACLGLYVGWQIGLAYTHADKQKRLSWDYLELMQNIPKLTEHDTLAQWWQLRGREGLIPEPLERIAAIRANLAFEDTTLPYGGLPFRIRMHGWFAGCLFR